MIGFRTFTILCFTMIFAKETIAKPEVSYAQGLAKALGSKNISDCDSITAGIFMGDHSSPVDEARQSCRNEVSSKTGNNQYCNSLPPDFSRFICLETFAHLKLDPQYCVLVTKDIFSEPGHKADFASYRDRCRAGAISKPEQCATGFETRSWKENFNDQCLTKIAINLKDIKWCKKESSPVRRQQCRTSFTQYFGLPTGL